MNMNNRETHTKKPKSQKKKGPGEGDDGFRPEVMDNTDVLSDDHTIGETVGTLDSNISDDLLEFDDIRDVVNDDGDEINDDNYLATRGKDRREAAVAAAASRHVKIQEAVASLAEYAAEKQSMKREQKLRRVFRAITQHATGSTGFDVVSDSTSIIQTACWHAIRTGQPAEQYAACRVLESTAVVLGADQDEWVQSLDRQLRRVVDTVQRAVPVRVAALRALGMSVFIGASDDSHTTESLMDFCELVSKVDYRNEIVPIQLRTAALDVWGLLATTLSDFDLAGQDDLQLGRGLAMLEFLYKDCLEQESADMDLRSAAGETVALIHEARLNLGIYSDAAANVEEANVTARQFQRGSWEDSQWEDVMDDIRQRVAELATESGYHLSKKAKKAQRATFREFTATIVDDEAPEEVVYFRNGNLTVTTWREIIQLNFVRHCLQGGFQIQLSTNATLQAIFGVNGTVVNDYGGMSQVEKRLILSKTSEAAKKSDRKRNKDRKKRENIKNDFILNENQI